MSVDDRNYYNDPRVCVPAGAPVLYMEDGTERNLPWEWSVCPVCRGNGSHVNPSIDAGGLTSADFADDPDFADDYMSGMYDVPCNRCSGKRVVPSVAWDVLTDEEASAYRQQLEDDAAADAAQRAELAMGC